MLNLRFNLAGYPESDERYILTQKRGLKIRWVRSILLEILNVN